MDMEFANKVGCKYIVMKRIIITLALLLLLSPLSAQRLVIGDRAPELRVGRWLNRAPESAPRLIEFFHSTSPQSVARLAENERIAEKYKSRLAVIVIAKEETDVIERLINPSERTFHVAIDDAERTFSAYGIQFVPYGVLLDSRGRIVWFGNPTTLTDRIIDQNL